MPSKHMRRREIRDAELRQALEREKTLAMAGAACPVDRAYLAARYERDMTGKYPEVQEPYYLYELGLSRKS